MRKYAFLSLIIVAISLLTTHCSKKEGMNPENYNGTWSGVTSQGKVFTFTVSGGAVTNINVDWINAGGGFCIGLPTGAAITLSGGNMISGNSFSIAGGLSVSGTFSSTNSATGSFIFTYPIQQNGCNLSLTSTWSATR